ncbi:MAG TPA: c-type cytochrome, partial [Kofleriaceae bacterium]|nr:c-type cytochrome [Kofleriaceae bacterium]
LAPPAAHAEGAKNLKVLPKNTSKKEIKKIMKGVSKSLGVKCDFCHNVDDFSKDSKKKETARGMMRMVNTLNKKYFAKADHKISCMTCHRGHEHPDK